MRNDKAKTIACLLALAIIFWAASKAGGVATPVHFVWGWPVDSAHWVHLVDSVRVDSALTKRNNITQWPDTTFDLTMGSRHEIWMYYWAPGLDSACWTKSYDYHDYNNANCVGGGDYVAALYVIDTATSPDSGVYHAKVSIKHDSSTGAAKTHWFTDNNGYVEFALDNGDWSAIASGVTFTFASSPIDFTVASGTHYDTIFGYRIPTPAPPSPDYATVEAYVLNPSGGKPFGATVTATRVSQLFGTDTTTTAVIVGGVIPPTSVDTAGYFSMSLMRTTAYDDTTTGFYDIVCKSPSGADLFTVKQLYVPATGNVNLGLIVARR